MTTNNPIQPGAVLRRDLSFTREAVDETARTVQIAFSSETPYERFWGVEILDHTPGAVRMGRLLDGAPLLVGHDTGDQIGVVESASIDPDRKGRALVRFGRSARAEEMFRDVTDNIRRKISVGYVIHAVRLESKTDGVGTYRVTDWEPYEISLVPVAADNGAGVGRGVNPAASPPPAVKTLQEQITMSDTHTPEQQDAVRAAATKETRDNINAILRMGAQYRAADLAQEYVLAGKTAEEFRDALLKRMANKPLDTAGIGMSAPETRRYSLMRALNALCNPGDRRIQEAAAFERECSDAVAAKTGRAARGFYVPHDVQTRDLTVGTTTAGGHTVGTSLLGASFVDVLRNRMISMQMGAQMLTGLTGNIAIPRQTGGATAYWVAESGAPTESQQAFDQVTMSPKTVGAYTDISRKLLLQSSIDIEAFVQNDLAKVLALAIDLAAINGSGSSNQPTGILNTAGIGSVAGGTNGAAPTWANIIELWQDVAVANADFGVTGYLTNAKVAGKLMSTEKASGTAQFVCPSFPDANGLTNFGGARAGISNQVPSNLTKGTASGVCSAIIFGNFADLIIGEWGTLDVTVDPYSNSTSGTVRVVALQDVDIAVRHAESFSAMLDALTT